MPGFDLGQPYGHGRTQQSTIVAGFSPGVSLPAAGASFAYVVQPYDYWRLVFCTFTLTTSATVASRYVTVEYPWVGGVSRVADGAAVTFPASTTAQRYVGVYGRGFSEHAAGTDVFFPLSGVWLEAGSQVRLNVANIDATDQLAAISLTFDRTPVEPLDYGYENERARIEDAERGQG